LFRRYAQENGDDPLSTGQWLIGFGLGVVIAVLAFVARSLSSTGALAAALVGGVTFGAGGFIPGVLLILFFVSSSLLSRVGKVRKRSLYSAFAKGGRRDHGQVFANGFIAAALAFLYGYSGEGIWLVGAAGALAASNGDTWSTELGVLSRTSPRLITNWAKVEPGTSGGVTGLGTLAALAGSALIGLVGGWMGADVRLALGATVAGLIGALFDSLLGASVQGIFHCPSCDRETEKHPRHSCGTDTHHLRGWRWLNNDAVNFAASMVGALIAMGLWLLGGQ
jgi:uncharacterized protein (TIGR00297 family)